MQNTTATHITYKFLTRKLRLSADFQKRFFAGSGNRTHDLPTCNFHGRPFSSLWGFLSHEEVKVLKNLTTALKGFLECPKQVLIHCKHSLNLIIWWKNASNNWTTSYNYGRLVNLKVSYVSSHSVEVTIEQNTNGQMHKSEPKYFIIESTLDYGPRCHARVHKEHKGTITDLHHLFQTFGLL